MQATRTLQLYSLKVSLLSPRCNLIVVGFHHGWIWPRVPLHLLCRLNKIMEKMSFSEAHRHDS